MSWPTVVLILGVPPSLSLRVLLASLSTLADKLAGQIEADTDHGSRPR